MLSSKSMDNCAHACHECQDACLTTIVHCLEQGGEHVAREHQTAMTDCAAMCALVHDFMRRESPHARHLCSECAEICRMCAESCERTAKDDAEMRSCAESCRSCADLCEEMASAIV